MNLSALSSLSALWADSAKQAHAHVLQTEFGSGLDVLRLWQAWKLAPQRPDRLTISALAPHEPHEPHAPHAPDLSHSALLAAVAGQAELRPLATTLSALGRGLLPGLHRLALQSAQVQLDLWIGPIETSLRELDVAADAIWLDPSHWAGEPAARRLQALARLCRRGTHLSLAPSWPAQRGAWSAEALKAWRAAGFELARDLTPDEAQGNKPDGPSHARFAPAWVPRSGLRQAPTPHERHVLVLGAGLSGSAVAHSLAVRGWSVTVLDQGSALGAGASGLPAGLLAPQVSPDDSVLSRISRAGVRATLQRAQALLQNGTDWAQSGVLEQQLQGKHQLPADGAWPAAGHEWSTPASAAQLASAGLPPNAQALWHSMAGWLLPRRLVAAQLNTPGVQVRLGQAVHSIAKEGSAWTVRNAQGQLLGQAPWLVVASAFDSLALLRTQPGFAVPLNPLRGQISHGPLSALDSTQRQMLPPFPVNGHGSFISGAHSPDGLPSWFIGATFERDATQAPVRAQDHAANQQRLALLLPGLGQAMADQFAPPQVQGWAGLRCTLPDRLPAVGPVNAAQLPGLWLCAGMGARGISWSVLCGELTAAWLENETLPLAPSLAKHLKADRFIDIVTKLQ